MQQDPSQLIRELQKETCPQRVIDNVKREISQKEPAPGHLRFALGALAAVVLLACLAMWLSHRNEKARLVERPKPDPTLVAHQAEIALALVGSELLDAGAQSEKIISNRAVPPLRNSIETAKNKLTHPIEL